MGVFLIITVSVCVCVFCLPNVEQIVKFNKYLNVYTYKYKNNIPIACECDNGIQSDNFIADDWTANVRRHVILFYTKYIGMIHRGTIYS